MTKWDRTIKIKYLFTDKEDYASVQESMSQIADVIDSYNLVPLFNTDEFRKIPKGDTYFKPADYANKMLDRFYDYADMHKLWVA